MAHPPWDFCAIAAGDYDPISPRDRDRLLVAARPRWRPCAVAPLTFEELLALAHTTKRRRGRKRSDAR